MVEPNREPEDEKVHCCSPDKSTSRDTEQGALSRTESGSDPKPHTSGDPAATGRDIMVKAGNATHSAEPQLLRDLHLASEFFGLVRKFELWYQSWALQQFGVCWTTIPSAWAEVWGYFPF